jgi:hypothetical protein
MAALDRERTPCRDERLRRGTAQRWHRPAPGRVLPGAVGAPAGERVEHVPQVLQARGQRGQRSCRRGPAGAVRVQQRCCQGPGPGALGLAAAGGRAGRGAPELHCPRGCAPSLHASSRPLGRRPPGRLRLCGLGRKLGRAVPGSQARGVGVTTLVASDQVIVDVVGLRVDGHHLARGAWRRGGG